MGDQIIWRIETAGQGKGYLVGSSKRYDLK